jgi:hypothetical protein
MSRPGPEDTASRAAAAVAETLRRLAPIDLDEIDRATALQRRIDRKYLLEADRFPVLADRLAEDHRVLEAAGTRLSRYESVYFDTPSLQCFRDHVEDRAPRFKVRTRLYVDTHRCTLEVKVHQADGETVKEHVPYQVEDHGRLTEEGRRFVADTLRRCVGRPAPPQLEPTLTTRFRRATLVAVHRRERATFDVDLQLLRPGGGCTRLDDRRVLVETKSPDGDGRCDRLLRESGVEEISLSKYRVGMALLTGDPASAGPAARWFST